MTPDRATLSRAADEERRHQMKTPTFYGLLHDGSGFGSPVTSVDRPLGVERVKERFIAPMAALSTGGVRPQVAVAPRATAAMTPTVGNAQAPLGNPPWSPPV
jgi:hypothetical protein